MLRETDFNPALLSTMEEEHKRILVDFANSVLINYGDVIFKDEIIKRIHHLKYIGFEKPEEGLKCSSDCDAVFHAKSFVLLSLKHQKASSMIIKSLLYHELMHVISLHLERDLDTCDKNPYERVGFFRDYFITYNQEYEGAGFIEGDLFEEIMTEYYSNILLQKEGIDFKGIYKFNSCCSSFDFVEYHGTGYQDYANLGQIYNFLFGNELLKAKLQDGNTFRQKFNDLFSRSDVFNNIFNDEGFDVSSYSKFVAEKGIMNRYHSACRMFIMIFKEKYQKDIKTVKDLLQNQEFDMFLKMLVKTRDNFTEEDFVNNDLYYLVKEFEMSLAFELFGNKVDEKKHGVNAHDIEAAIMIVLEKICQKNHDMAFNRIQYKVFYEPHFKGVYLVVDGNTYIIDYESLCQGDDFYAAFQKFSSAGFSQDEINNYSKEFQMDVSNASFATIRNPITRKSFILNNGQLYNHYGDRIDISDLEEYKTHIKEGTQK